jgi:hypothetical protein
MTEQEPRVPHSKIMRSRRAENAHFTAFRRVPSHYVLLLITSDFKERPARNLHCGQPGTGRCRLDARTAACRGSNAVIDGALTRAFLNPPARQRAPTSPCRNRRPSVWTLSTSTRCAQESGPRSNHAVPFLNSVCTPPHAFTSRSNADEWRRDQQFQYFARGVGQAAHGSTPHIFWSCWIQPPLALSACLERAVTYPAQTPL